MSLLTKTLTSSVGKKFMMALTGLFLSAFLVVHLIGNLQLFNADGGYAFNNYAVFMTSFPLIKVLSYVTYALILYHAVLGITISRKNAMARPIGYSTSNRKSPWYSRQMALLGTIILVYIVVHMGNFWYKYHFQEMPYTQYTETLATGEVDYAAKAPGYTQTVNQYVTYNEENGTKTTVVKDLYKVTHQAFGNLWLVLFYVIGMIALAYHLMHGFQSAFQTFGIRQARYKSFIINFGKWVFGILIPIGFAIIPLVIYFTN